MTDKKFIEGLILKPKHDRAPEYVICKLSIKREEMIAWLTQQDGEWINADVKESQGGKLYAQVDDWKPEGRRQEAPKRQQSVDERFEDVRHQRVRNLQRDMPNNFDDSDIPF